MRVISQLQNGSICIYKREKSPYYQTRIKIGKKWIKISTGTDDLKSAEDFSLTKYQELKFKYELNIPVISKSFTYVSECSIRKMEDALEAGYGKVTYKDYIRVIRSYFIPFFGKKEIDKITFKDIKEFDEYRIKRMKHQPSFSTINTHNSALNYVFDYGVDKGWIMKSNVPVLKNIGVKSERRPHFTKDEYKHLLSSMNDWVSSGIKSKTRDIRVLLCDYILILGNTGMRCGKESLDIKWKHIEEFEHTDHKKYIRIHVNGKTGKREVVCRLSVRKYLESIRDRFDDIKGKSFSELSNNEDYVFRLPSGERPSDIHGSFEQLLIYTNLLQNRQGERRSLYSLRHTYATFNLMDGIDIHLLSRQLGTSVTMIEKHYSHLIPSHSANILAGKDYSKLGKIGGNNINKYKE